MGCSIVHFSATGKTLKVAEAVAKGLGGVGRLIDLSRPDFKGASLSSSDKVIVACPVYGGRIPSVVAERIKAVKFDATRVVTVVSYGNRAFEDALLELNDCVIAQGGGPVASAAVIAQHAMEPSVASDRPDKTDYQNLESFGRFALKKYEEVDVKAVQVPGNRPYRDWAKMPVTPISEGACIHCGLCANNCPTQAIDLFDTAKTDPNKCILCLRCVWICPQKVKRLPDVAQKAIAEKLAHVRGVRKENEFFF